MKLVPHEDLPSLHSLKLNQVNGIKLQFKLYMDNFILPFIRTHPNLVSLWYKGRNF